MPEVVCKNNFYYRKYWQETDSKCEMLCVIREELEEKYHMAIVVMSTFYVDNELRYRFDILMDLDDDLRNFKGDMGYVCLCHSPLRL